MDLSKRTRIFSLFSFFLAGVLSFSILAPTLLAQGQNSPALFFPPDSIQRDSIERQSATSSLQQQQEERQREQNYEQLTSCFDFYRFGSTPVVLSAELNSVAAGAQVEFSGTITNENIYPLVDTSVYAKVFRKSDDVEGKNVNGPDVVDFITLADSLDLKPGEVKEFSFVWDVPVDAQPGDYKLASYVAAADRFNMLGLSFTDDVIGGSYSFSVVGESRGAVRFDKTSVTVADLPFRFAAYPPRVPGNVEEVPVLAEIQNTTNTAKNLTVNWKLYKWDMLREDAVLDEESQQVIVPPGESVPVSFTVTDTNHSVYYLVGSLETRHGSESIIGVRYVRGDVNEPRLNFVGLSQSPDNDKEGAIFACVHSTGTAFAPDGELKISVAPTGLLGMLNIPFLTQSYRGPIPGEIMALPVSFIAPLPASAVTAELYQEGELVDSVTVSYSCDVLGGLCGYPWWAWAPLAVTLILIVLVGGVLIARKRNKEHTDLPPDENTTDINNQRV